MHSGGNHWVTVSTDKDGSLVRVYDSLSYGRLSSDLKEQIFGVVSSKRELWCSPMQQQANSDDCGLFAIAAAMDLCMGINPSGVQYDERQLRTHFAKCLESEQLLTFPRRKKKLTEAVIYID
jgi:hypothetical protein